MSTDARQIEAVMMTRKAVEELVAAAIWPAIEKLKEAESTIASLKQQLAEMEKKTENRT